MIWREFIKQYDIKQMSDPFMLEMMVHFVHGLTKEQSEKLEKYKRKPEDYPNNICLDCPKSIGKKAGKDVFGMWQTICDICFEDKPCAAQEIGGILPPKK